MALLLSFMMSVLFSLFFYRIGVWYFAFLPIAFFIFMLTHSFGKIFTQIDVKDSRYTYSLFLIWILVMIGISGLLFFVGIKEIHVFLSLLVLNIFLRIAAHVFDYQDGKELFEYGAYVLTIIILGESLISYGWKTLRIVASIFVLLRL